MNAPFDIVVIGSGPAGQKAAIQGCKAGRSVLVVEGEDAVGGACVHRGTIPSKTLRETAVALGGFRRRTAGVYEVSAPDDLQVQSLMQRLDEVVRAHERFMEEQLRRNGAEMWHGRGSFVSPSEIEVLSVTGERRRATGKILVIASGSRPRTPSDVAIDHQNILDSDSILSMTYLPLSLTVVGAGVIASEYASIFATLGVQVTMIDRGERPVAFLDGEVVDRFLQTFKSLGGRFLPKQKISNVAWDGVSSVVTRLESGEEIRSEKMLYALGRVANLNDLHVERAGLAPNERGLLTVDAHCRTAVPNIYAVGDVIGPPSLASTSMEQGRRAVCHALGIDVGQSADTIPLAVYTIPEMASVGLSEAQAIERHGGAMVGRARFHELARGQISAIQDGLVKLVSDGEGRTLLGAQIVGEGAAELIHVAQMALIGGATVDSFVDNIFNFPTLAEGYRVAALDIVKQRRK